MEVPNKVNQIILGIIFVIVSIQLAKVAMQGIFPSFYILFIILSIILFLKSKWENIVLIFIIMYPMQDVLPSEALLIPGIGIVEIVLIMLIVKYFMTYKRINFDLDRIQKLAISLSFFFIIIYTGTFYTKHYFIYGLGGITYSRMIIRLVKLLFLFITIALIVSKSKEPKVQSAIINGLTTGFIIYGISVIFSNYFIDMGLNVSSEFEYERGIKSRGILKDRAVGLFTGSSGFFTHYLLVGFGFFLVLMEQRVIRNFYNIIGILAATIGIIFSGARTGLLTMGIILFLYILKNFNPKKILNTIPVIIIISIIIIKFGDFALGRMEFISDEITEETFQLQGRVYFQSYYINEILDNSIYLLTGYTKKSSLGRWRVPHNQFVGMVFWGGLPYLFIFLFILYKIYKCHKIRYNSFQSFSILYPFIGFVIPYLFNPNELVVYFPLILSVSSGITMGHYSKCIESTKTGIELRVM